MKKILMQALILSIVFFTACEEQPIEIKQTVPDTDRKVLIEEFTGANCAACPAGARTIKTLKEAYGDKIIAIAIHTTRSGPLGEPLSGSSYDFRTDKGDNLVDLFGGLSGIPASVFNRTKYEDENRMAVLAPDTWPDRVLSEFEKESVVNLSTDLDYDATTRTLTIGVEAIPLITQTGDYRINVMITESKIIDYQNDGGVVDSMYQNDHVLREIISAESGDAFASEFVTNDPISATYTFEVPEGDGVWIVENCSVVTFISEVDEENGTIEVLQADEKHLID